MANQKLIERVIKAHVNYRKCKLLSIQRLTKKFLNSIGKSSNFFLAAEIHHRAGKSVMSKRCSCGISTYCGIVASYKYYKNHNEHGRLCYLFERE